MSRNILFKLITIIFIALFQSKAYDSVTGGYGHSWHIRRSLKHSKILSEPKIDKSKTLMTTIVLCQGQETFYFKFCITTLFHSILGIQNNDWGLVMVPYQSPT